MAGLAVVALVVALSLLAPDPAQAIDLNPLHTLDDVLGAGVNAVTGGVGKMAVEAFGGVVKALFSWPAKLINRELLAWLVAIPNYSVHPEAVGAGRDGSNLARLGTTTSAMAFAALGAVGTVSGIRYWAAGLTGAGGLEALEGLGRTVAAALAIVVWPWSFRHCADLANQAGAGLLGSGTVLDDTARLLAGAFLAAVAFNILALLIAIGAAVLLLGLLLTKIAVSAATALMYVAMPLALMLWPIPELAWIARTAMRGFATVLAIPLAWAVSFATFSAVGADALALRNAGKVVDALVMPLVGLALLWITVVLPKTLARLALLGSLGGGFISRTVSHVMARRADAALAHASSSAPSATATGQGNVVSMPSGQAAGPRPIERSADAVLSASEGARRHGTPRSSRTIPATPSSSGADYPAAPQDSSWKPPEGFEHARPQRASGGAAGIGLRTPSWQEIKDRVPVELAAAARRESVTTRSDVALAMRALSPEAQQGVIGLMETKGGQIRGQMAHQAARDDLSDDEREAFRALAAATPETRTQGISDFLADAQAPVPPGIVSSELGSPAAQRFEGAPSPVSESGSTESAVEGPSPPSGPATPPPRGDEHTATDRNSE